MPTSSRWRTVGARYLATLPFLAAVLAFPRPLRWFDFAPLIGLAIALGAVVPIAARLRQWQGDARTALGAACWLAPWVLVALLWTGIGTPDEANPVENRMRYAVLVSAAVLVTIGGALVSATLREAGAKLAGTLAGAGSMLAGAGYLAWTSMQLGIWVLRAQPNATAPAATLQALSDVGDSLLFASGLVTYVTAATFAWGLADRGVLGRFASRVHLAGNAVLGAALMARGFAFPDPATADEPWWQLLGFFAGIPAVPWLLLGVLGARLLQHGEALAAPGSEPSH